MKTILFLIAMTSLVFSQESGRWKGEIKNKQTVVSCRAVFSEGALARELDALDWQGARPTPNWETTFVIVVAPARRRGYSATYFRTVANHDRYDLRWGWTQPTAEGGRTDRTVTIGGPDARYALIVNYPKSLDGRVDCAEQPIQ